MNGAEGGKQMGGPPPGWTGGPPPGWTGGPPQGMGGPPQGPNGSAPQTPGGPPPGWTGGPPPGWTGGPPPGWTGGPPGQGCPPSGIPPAMMQQMMQQMMGQGGSPPSDSGEPKMYGMTPVTPNANQLPRAFAEVFGQQPIPQQPSTPSPPPEGAPDDEYAALEAETLKAEARWAGIKRELEEFKANLGPDYDPLPDYAMPVRETPFGGPAIYFRTFPMAILHTLYYTALIILERCHPSMPAMSMQAAMVCADRAEHIANTIGRITAGLFPESGTEQINPARGASLIESTIPLFFAGVQYRHASQREWLKHKLREIHRITGWASASRVLLGCYRAWEIAGEKGLAERFTRPPDSEEEDVPRPETEGGTIVGGEEEGRNFVVRAGARLEMAVGLLGEPGTIEEVVARM
ncbi:hypothetical protein BJ508DRAFT_419859 [Ascobolus immersus RN42]|uniref:Transcription factor domain-containing protein n=1 Tax=Ascobolus immersus RN42 TaxID=1160509 RepID=A0A3N4HD81_ASCIM|nr:hypothetical protein BJ508DRAFT_419859 [Ascobolus immersus RN42]